MYAYAIAFARWFYKFSIGLRSEGFADHDIRSVATSSRRSSTKCAHCERALSSMYKKSDLKAPLKNRTRPHPIMLGGHRSAVENV